jgi:hypothetical protein
VIADIGMAGSLGQVVLTLGLLVWAGEEVLTGANLFRRLLGAATLLWLILELAGVK